ncbi:MAG: hypothetical protein O3C40_34000 [Planctomycetota bacterium]|nr:hypothetical protein [Planctomycetota bacterium]
MISGFAYELDATGNRTAKLKASGKRTTWTYDATYQLVNERPSGANAYNTTFVYDAVGNRLVKNADGALTTSTYDAANQTQISQAAAGVTTYTFDADGNQQIVVQPDGKRTTYVWDYENQNTRVELPNGSRVTMIYNADNRRVERKPDA